ncbi:MAG: YmfQ family protein, partial [Selenomonas bovis]|nr:YmfQ family protein [Selenomonas bovis]
MGWLRDEKVDISRYLPEFVRGDPVLGQTLAIESKEHERQRMEIRDLLAQAFIDTATWGLADWERILDLKPDAGDNYEARRNRILLKLQGRQTSTVAFITNLIKRYCTEKSKVTVIEDNEHYMFHA